MKRTGTRALTIAWVTGAIVAAIATGLVWRFSLFASRMPLRDLQDAPLESRVRLAGVVTYPDGPGKRFWIQDDTGAMLIPADPTPLQLHAGQTVEIKAVKSSRYDATEGPSSVHFSDIKVSASRLSLKLAQPLPISIAQFPTPDKNGMQVQVFGVLHGIQVDPLKRTQLYIAATGAEIPVVVPGSPADYQQFLNAQISVVGVPESTTNPAVGQPRQRIWVALRQNVQEVEAPPASHLFTIRGLYLDARNNGGHLLRVRGKVTENSPRGLTLQDEWGSIDIRPGTASAVAVGAQVEAEGYPSWDGLRISLSRARVRTLPGNPPGLSTEQMRHLPVLTTVRQIRELSAERAAEALPLKISGVVTYVDPIWRQFYLQDATGGIYAKYSGYGDLRAGMRVSVTGITNPGNFAPVIVAPIVTPVGRAHFPPAVQADVVHASAGLLDSQYVSIEGVVHPLKTGEDFGHPIITFELFSTLGQVHVNASPRFSAVQELRGLEDARVRIRGVLGTVFNNRRQIIGYQLAVENPEQIQILEPAPQNPLATPPTPIAKLLQFSPDMRPGHRVRISGLVTYLGRDRLFLQDSTGGVEVRGQTDSLKVGDAVDALGYPILVGRYAPVMTDAVFQPQGKSGTVAPLKTDPEEILKGEDDSRLVSVEARLLTSVREPSRAVLALRSGIRTFSAELDTTNRGDDLSQLRSGSILRLTGVCVSQVDPNRLYTVLERAPSEFRILLRSPHDVQIVSPAPFWTTRNVLILLIVVSLLIPTILIWVVVLRRRVRLQTSALRKAAETTQALRDLSASMQKVAQDQRYDKKVYVRGNPEVAQLVVGFNQMLAELHQRDEAKKAAEAKLQHMAMVDELTGLPNRRMLFDRLQHSLATARRDKHMVGLLYLDLDGFKLVNDTYGHNIGDLLLIQVAQRLRSRARASDTVSRIGGDEFTLILDRIKDPADADTAAQSVLDSIEAPFSIEGHRISIGVSVGISLYPQNAAEGGQLLQQADCAMYAAKRNGKGQFVQFGDELGNAARERMTIENELRSAIADHAIVLHYQPEFDLATHEITRFEALARWHHPSLGNISPLHFIPIAEENGLIFPLGAQILSAACRAAREWNRIAGRDIPVAVNVSSVQFARDSFADELRQILQETDLDPRLLQLELTESATLAGIDRSADLLKGLKDLGVSLAIDDFGTGYSCLSYLPRLPFDALKVDRSFVSELVSRPESRAFLESIVTMAHNLNMKVIVEGIETQAELSAVIELGADEAQGFLLGRATADVANHLQAEANATPAQSPADQIATEWTIAAPRRI